MDVYILRREREKGEKPSLPTDSHKQIRPILNLINTNPKNPFHTHPADWNTTCAVPNSVDGGACIFARARPTSSLSGLTNRKSKVNRPSPSLSSLVHNTSDGCPTIVSDWMVIPRAATLERKKKKVNSRKLQAIN